MKTFEFVISMNGNDEKSQRVRINKISPAAEMTEHWYYSKSHGRDEIDLIFD